MPSNKKKLRGKQRKAAKQQKDRGYDSELVRHRHSIDVDALPRHGCKLSVCDVLKGLRSCQRLETEALIRYFCEGPSSPDKDSTHYSFQRDMIENGLISVLTDDLLNRCGEPLNDVVMEASRSNGNQGDYSRLISSPFKWIDILARVCNSNVVEADQLVKVVTRIGPFVKCMCNDQRQQLFQSTKHWNQSISSFVELVAVFLEGAKCKESRTAIVDAFLQYDVYESLIQWRFWEEHRPDIVSGIKSHYDSFDISTFSSWANRVLVWLIAEAIHNTLSSGRLRLIGKTPIVCLSFEPNCKTSFVVGIIQLYKSTQKKFFFDYVELAVTEAFCFDKYVIKELIDFGLNFAKDYVDALQVSRICGIMLYHIDDPNQLLQPSDTRFAVAIRAGLCEMCMDFILRFGLFGNDHNDCDLRVRVTRLMIGVSHLALHSKSFLAIRARRDQMEAKLNHMSIHAPFTSKDFVCMVQSILQLKACCPLCHKYLERNNINCCAGCKSYAYCSKKCQQQDWLVGNHQMECRDIQRWRESLSSSGRYLSKVDDLNCNMLMVSSRLFDVHQYKFRAWEPNKEGLYDVFALFDLRRCPFRMTKTKYTDVIDAELREVLENNRREGYISCLFRTFHCNGVLDKDGRWDSIHIIRNFHQYSTIKSDGTACTWPCMMH